jgi:hypothetical protein
LRAYAKRAKKLTKKGDPALDKVMATEFVHGIRNKSLRVMVAANSQSKTDYTFKEVYQAVQAVARARREDSDSDSSSSSSVTTDSSMGGESRRHRDAKRPKESKVEEVEVKMPVPASPSPSPKFDMEELANVIKEAVQATTRELVGSYGLGPGPSSALDHPPQAPLIGSYAVSPSQSTGRSPFQGRGYPMAVKVVDSSCSPELTSSSLDTSSSPALSSSLDSSTRSVSSSMEVSSSMLGSRTSPVITVRNVGMDISSVLNHHSRTRLAGLSMSV